MIRRFAGCMVAATVLVAFSGGVTLAKSKSTSHGKSSHVAQKSSKSAKAGKHASKDKGARHKSAKAGRHHEKHAAKGKTKTKQVRRQIEDDEDDTAPAVAKPELTGDPAILRQTLDLARKGKVSEAVITASTVSEPAGRKLAEWLILRTNESIAFRRYAAFLAANPGWPGQRMLRARAEGELWHERAAPATVRSFIGNSPVSAKGRLSLARALVAEGDRAGAQAQLQEVWRTQELTERLESDVLREMGDLLAADDHRARMDMRLGSKDGAGAMRAAQRLGPDAVAVVKACAAARGDAKKASDLLNDVPASYRNDLGLVLCRAEWLARKDRIVEAATVIVEAPAQTMAQQNTDEWWRLRRTLARKLLDMRHPDLAYQVTASAALPANPNYQAESHFLPGWIALRFRADPATAAGHFAHIDDGNPNPIVLARAAYWRGRAAEAAGDSAAARAQFAAAAAHPTAYYGQLAREKLGLGGFALRRPPVAAPLEESELARELVRAAEFLYAIGERDMVVSLAADLGERSDDVAVMVALGELTARQNDARSMLQVGKSALARGIALDLYAFPDIGIPPHKQVAPPIDLGVIYSVARTESAFDQKDVSPAKAVGLMQVTPEAGRDTARRFNVSYDWSRMVNDPVYNTQMGAAELSALFKEYGGSYAMVFAGYNAGRGRVQQWVKQFGDPRDPKVDAVDWVERIPLSETRNYVQRVIENVAVYKVRLEGSPATAWSEVKASAE